eukprot:SAG11_NODE_15958_length_561_cov_1.218615_1_plen_49_part_00
MATSAQVTGKVRVDRIRTVMLLRSDVTKVTERLDKCETETHLINPPVL